MHVPSAYWPRAFAFSCEKRGLDPFDQVARLPAHCGFIFRHYGVKGRDDLALSLRLHCAQLGLPFFVAGDLKLAKALGADGLHWPGFMGPAPSKIKRQGIALSTSVHSFSDLRRAHIWGADAVFVSPIFTTQSHPNARTLGPGGFAVLARHTPLKIYSLGGMDERKMQRLPHFSHFLGYGAISAFQAQDE